ncbi:glycoside hydrolase family 113 [Aquimarina algiphila]|uniref:glycoside hydrolase family 113 n=1 Tax=Aquimarina algiphila TaxID=2047982 RepID=UPI00248F759A|nr:hypothetical protein [Aquimarina algiphila]
MKKELFSVIKVYLVTWLISILLILSLLLFRAELSLGRSFRELSELLLNSQFLISLHVLFAVLYILFLILRYFIRVYRIHGIKTMSKRLVLRVIIPVLFLFLIFKSIVYANSSENFIYEWDHTVENTGNMIKDHYKIDKKHRGMSVFGWSSDNEKPIIELVKNNIEWVAVIPFIAQKDQYITTMGTPEIIGKWSHRDSVFIKTITQLKAKGIHVQLKPHIWVNDGWRSDIALKSKNEWNVWFDSYRDNLIHYAKMAEETGVELLCVGTELRTSLKHMPDRWTSLIKEIKTIYHGQLTYAANWDGEFELIEFWEELDYIGIQAYFPITKTSKPDLETLKRGWDKHIIQLESLSKAHNKPILFTEIGYKSEVSATIRPWEWGSFLGILYQKKSDQTQHLAYEALFKQLWNKKWFAGTYIWQWDTRTPEDSAPTSLGFSPRYKPAQNTIAKWYAKL